MTPYRPSPTPPRVDRLTIGQRSAIVVALGTVLWVGCLVLAWLMRAGE